MAVYTTRSEPTLDRKLGRLERVFGSIRTHALYLKDKSVEADVQVWEVIERIDSLVAMQLRVGTLTDPDLKAHAKGAHRDAAYDLDAETIDLLAKVDAVVAGCKADLVGTASRGDHRATFWRPNGRLGFRVVQPADWTPATVTAIDDLIAATRPDVP